MPQATETPTDLDGLAGLLVTKGPGQKSPVNSDTDRSAALAGDDHVENEPEIGDTATPGEDAGEGGDDVWNSLDDAEDALLGEQSEDGEPPDESESGDEEDEGDGTPQEAFYTVKRGGKEERVPLSELIAGYQRNADYTQKTQALSAKQKATDDEHTVLTQKRGAYDAMLADLQARVEGQLTARKPEEWETLKVNDPVAYAAEWTDYQRKQEARNALVTERKRVADEQLAENNTKLREFINGEREKLFTKVPAWRDPAKFTAAQKALFDFASKTYGYTNDELKVAVDHRIYLLAQDAYRYRALVAKQKVGKAKLDTAPVVPPRGRTQPRPAAARQKEEATKRLRSTGKIDDAIAVIMGR